MAISPREIPPGPVSEEQPAPLITPALTGNTTLDNRHIAYELAQQARARFNAQVGQINAEYTQLKAQLRIEFDRGFDALREERARLLSEQPRDVAAVLDVERRMRDYRLLTPPSPDNLEAERQERIRNLDIALNAELADLRKRRDAGELLDTGEYV